MRPRIGITTSTLERGPEGPIRTASATHLVYSYCIYQAGGLPLLLPSLPAVEDVDEILAPLDGLLLSGGGDIDSSYWGEPLHPAANTIDSVRDQYEIALVHAALRRKIPLLGVCRGMQVMAVAAGGSLWQDLPDQVPMNIGHRQSTSRHIPSHPVTTSANSLLARIICSREAQSNETLTFHVNSFHHQAPRTCGTIFAAIAWSPDGIIESLALADGHFALGVQWHPEEMADTDPVQAQIISAFVGAAQGRPVFDSR